MGKRDDLIEAMAKLVAHRRAVNEAKETLRKRAVEHLDTIREPIHQVEQHVAAEQGGGVLAARRLRVLHDERARLDRLVVAHDGG